MVDKIQPGGEYSFYILGQHRQGKLSSTFGRKKLNLNEISTATILARYKHDNKVMETVIPKVPLFLWDAFNCLSNSGSVNNEIFRKSGSIKRITDFFNQNPTVFARGSNFDGLNHLDIGTLMKDFLRERQDALFTSGDPLLIELELLSKRRVGIQFDTDQNPEFSSLLFILKVLHWMCLKDDTGRMTPMNMAVYFNPIFIHNQVKESRDLKKGKMINDKKDSGKMTGLQKDRVQRDIAILAALISHSQNLVVKSGLGSRYRSNSITPGVSSREEEGRRSSSVIGRFMKYVGKEKMPKVISVPISLLINKEFTPEGRQARSRARRTPTSAKSAHSKTPLGQEQSLTHPTPPSFSHVTPARLHYQKISSNEKSPKMRNEQKVEYLLEARKRLDFTDREENGNHEGDKDDNANDQPIPLDELLTSLQRSVEQLNATPTPTSPDSVSTTLMKIPSPQQGNVCTSPEVVVKDLIDSLCENEAELSSVCDEIQADSAAIEKIKKEVKDQGCSPFRFSPDRMPFIKPSTSVKSKTPPREELISRAAVSRTVPSPTKVASSPLSCRTASGGWDWKSHVMHSKTREELDAHFKDSIPANRPSIALLSTFKRVTTNVARLEKNREEEQEATRNETARLSLRSRTSGSHRTSFDSTPKELEESFKIPFLPKSKSAGNAAIGMTSFRILNDKSSTQNSFAVPRLPAVKSAKFARPTLNDQKESHTHGCRQFRAPGVPSYAASTFASAQHSVLRPLPDSPSTADFHRPGNTSVVSPKARSYSLQPAPAGPESNSASTIPTLDDLSFLISKMSVSSLNSSLSEKEND